MDVKTFENTRWSEKPQKPEFRHKAALALVTSGTVLDIGCGDGLLLSMLKEKGIQSQGIDLSEVAVEHCRARGLDAVQGDFANEPLPYAEGAYACVIALDVLEHVYDPDAVLKEMARVASQTIVIGVPNFSSLPARLQTLIGKVPENNLPHKGHIYWFNWQVLQRLAKKNNLHVVTVKMNVVWEQVPLVGTLSYGLSRLFPNLFALSFVSVLSK